MSTYSIESRVAVLISRQKVRFYKLFAASLDMDDDEIRCTGFGVM